MANALLKELHFMRDTRGDDVALHYLRTKDGVELDFLITINDEPTHMIEIKHKDDQPVKAFANFEKFISNTIKLQLVKTLKREKTYPTGLEIR